MCAKKQSKAKQSKAKDKKKKKKHSESIRTWHLPYQSAMQSAMCVMQSATPQLTNSPILTPSHRAFAPGCARCVPAAFHAAETGCPAPAKEMLFQMETDDTSQQSLLFEAIQSCSLTESLHLASNSGRNGKVKFSQWLFHANSPKACSNAMIKSDESLYETFFVASSNGLHQ